MEAERPHCLVIGVGAGTGLACVRRFVAGGYKVSMVVRHKGRLANWAKDIANTAPYPSDLTDLAHSRATLEQIKAEQGLPKVVVYNAGVVNQYVNTSPSIFNGLNHAQHLI